MQQKVVRLGVRRDEAFVYYLELDGVHRVAATLDEDGDPQPDEAATPELVVPKSWEWEPGYTYDLDSDGDLARWRELPQLRWTEERCLPALKDDRSSSRVNTSPGRYWVVAGDEDPDHYLAADAEAPWSFTGDVARVEIGDGLFVWIDKPHHCLVALAEVSGAPREDEDGDYEIPIRFLTNTTMRPLYRDNLLYDDVLENAAFLQPKPEVITALTDAQVLRLLRWMQHRNPATAAVCAVWSKDLVRRLGSDDPFVPADDHEREPVKPPAETIETVRLTSGQEYRVLSVHPPWAWAIIFAAKDVENRSWTTPYRGPILIHASSKKYVGRALQEVRAEIAANSGLDPGQIPKEFPRSQMIGMVDVKACISNSRSRWALKGEEHWVLDNPRRLDPPTEGIDGKLNLWTWRAP